MPLACCFKARMRFCKSLFAGIARHLASAIQF